MLTGVEYHGSFRPFDFISRDMGLFKDDDGTGYLLTEDVGSKPAPPPVSSFFEASSTPSTPKCDLADAKAYHIAPYRSSHRQARPHIHRGRQHRL